MTNAFSKTYGCITFTDAESLIKDNILIMTKYNLLRESWESKKGEVGQKEYREMTRIMILREVLYLVYGFKPNKVFVINC
tara:strand:- start:673 stop:912 length:240 start_codon:yes stop_codon:yes gene_type:complete